MSLALWLAIAVGCLATPTATAELSYGVHVDYANSYEHKRLTIGGASLVRTPLRWQDVEPSRNRGRDWDTMDLVVTRALRNGLSLLPVIVGSPGWAAPSPSEQPRSRGDLRRFKQFVSAAVARYGPGGRLFSKNPLLPYRPITAWEVWNEPNLSLFWNGDPDPREYAEFLQLTSTAIRRVDPGATVVLAGMPEDAGRIPASEFLQQLYRVPDIDQAFDVVAAHPYEASVTGIKESLHRLRYTMDSNSDAETEIWITELGWASGGPPSNWHVTTRTGQAELFRQTFTMLAAEQARLRLGPVIWFDLRDRERPAGARDLWWYHTGFFERDGDPKPAWQAFVTLVGGDPGSGRMATKAEASPPRGLPEVSP